MPSLWNNEVPIEMAAVVKKTDDIMDNSGNTGEGMKCI